MAVSLALNWSPPASTSLFDDVASPTTGDGNNAPTTTASPTAASSAADAGSPRSHAPAAAAATTGGARRPSAPSAFAVASPSLSSSSSSSSSTSSLAVGAPGSSTLGVQPPARSMSASPQPTHIKSYAAAAAAPSASTSSLSSLSSSSPPHTASIVTATERIISPVRTGDGAAAQPQVGQSITFPTATANTVTWQQYQQMVSQARQQSTPASADSAATATAGGTRRRTTSGPQRAPASFTDAHQQNPLPPLSYAPNAVPSHLRQDVANPTMVHSNSTPAVTTPGSGGFHPYRRTPRSSSTTAAAAPALPNIQFGTMLDSADALALTSPGGTDAGSRTGSSSASPTARSAAGAAGNSAAPLSYSSVAAGALRGQVGAPPAAGPSAGATTNDTSAASSSTYDGYAARTEQGRRPSDASSITTPGAPAGFSHIRNTSFSSQISTSTERERPVLGTGAPKMPSPLSRQQQPPSAMTTAQIAAQKKSIPNKLRKAMSFSSMSEFGSPSSDGTSAAAGSKSTGRRGELQRMENPNGAGGIILIEGGQAVDSPPMTPDHNGLGSSAASISSRRSGRPPLSGSGEGGGSKRSLFNRKFNASTDNISISSTVSSASVMLRKMGNLGKLARRHSLMGLTNMFKDKDRSGGADGREGLHSDDFGTMTGSGAMSADGLENSASAAAASGAAAGASKMKRGKNKKAAPVAASITHATVELETGAGTMTPAASYVRQHQLQMRQQHPDAGPVVMIGHSPHGAPPSHNQSPGLLSRVRNVSADSTSTARNAASSLAAAAAGAGSSSASAAENRNQKMFEKEKERMKKQRGWKKMLPGGGGGSSSSNAEAAASKAAAAAAAQRAQPTGLETYAASDEEQAPGYGSATNAAYAGGSRGGWNAGPAMSSALPNSAAALYGEPPEDGFYGEDDDDELEPPHAPYADGAAESGDEYETDSLRHWGEGIERSRASAAQIKSVKSILRAHSAYGPDPAAQGNGGPNGHGHNARGGGGPPAFAGSRVRSSSFDATQGSGAPGVPLMSQMSNTTEGTDRMDGLSTARAESPSNFASAGAGGARSESPRHARNGDEAGGSTSPPLASPPAGVSATTNLGHHANSSMPTLSLMMDPASSGGRASSSGPTRAGGAKKRLVFADAHIFHSTWPAHVYDRRGELATCNRLTPALAQSIKEELNSFKMEEMVVAPSSRIYTHFFV